MNNRRFRKIRISDKGYSFVYDKQNESSFWESHSVTSDEMARPEFEKAMQKLSYCLADMCELDIQKEQVSRNVYVNEVRYTYPQKKPSYLILKGQAYLRNLHTLIMTSPAWDLPTVHSTGWDADFFKALTNLEKEAWKYIDGDRAQTKLKFESAAEEVENPVVEEDEE